MVEIVEFGDDDVEWYADVLADTVAAVSHSGVVAGAAALQSIAREIWMGRLTTTAGGLGAGEPATSNRLRNETLRTQVFVRDGFRCTYCGRRAVPRSILVAIHDLFPDNLPYDVRYHRGKVHPVFWALAPEADHVLAHAAGGEHSREPHDTARRLQYPQG